MTTLPTSADGRTVADDVRQQIFVPVRAQKLTAAVDGTKRAMAPGYAASFYFQGLSGWEPAIVGGRTQLEPMLFFSTRMSGWAPAIAGART